MSQSVSATRGSGWMHLAIAGAMLAVAAACGGGGGASGSPASSTRISGTAAAGAPIVGTITVQDSSTPAKARQTSILGDGTYAIDVAGMTGPFMLRADGAVDGIEVHLYSGAVQADVGGTINVTPFTDLILSNIAGALAKTYFDGQGFRGLTADAIASSSSALRERVLPVLQALGVGGAIDLMRISFSADHTGFDRVMDIVKVTVDPATQVATIRNIITGQQITDDLKVQGDLGVLDDVTGLDDLAAIDNQLRKFATLFATSVPLPTHPELLALFDQQGFMNEGADLSAFLAQITSSSDLIGVRFANLEVKSIQGDTAQVVFNSIIGGVVGDPVSWQAVKRSGAWLFRGNQRLGSVGVRAVAVWEQASGTLDQSSLWLGVSDDYGRFDTAKVTGPGISGTLTLTKSVTSDTFRLSGNVPFVPMTDALVDAIPDSGATYRFSLYAAGVLQAAYDATLGKRPYKPSELSGPMFPVLSPATDAALTAFSGGVLNVAWTMPAALTPRSLEVSIGDPNDVHVNRVWVDLAATATGYTATLEARTATGQSFTPTWRNIHLSGNDLFGRELLTSLWR